MAFVLVVYNLPSGEVKMKSVLSSMPCLLEFLVINIDPITMEKTLKLLVVYQLGIPQCSLFSLRSEKESLSHVETSEHCSIVEDEDVEDPLPRSFPISGPEIITSAPILNQPSSCGLTRIDSHGSLSPEEEQLVKSPGTSQKSNSEIAFEIPEEPQKEMTVVPYKSQLKEETKKRESPIKHPKNLKCFSSVQKCSSKLTEMKLNNLEHQRLNWKCLQKTESMKNRIQALKKRVASSSLQKPQYVNLPPAEIHSSPVKTR